MFSLGQRFAAFCFALFMALALQAPRAHAGAYEAELPANLASTPDMCSLLPCTEVFPGATHFSERKGQPPYVEAYDNDSAQKKLLGYVMLSTDITDTPAYSGKPVVTLIGMDTKGHFVGLKVLKHSEPIPAAGHPGIGPHQFQQPVRRQVGDRHHRGRPLAPRRERDRRGRHLGRHRHRRRAEPGGHDLGRRRRAPDRHHRAHGA